MKKEAFIKLVSRKFDSSELTFKEFLDRLRVLNTDIVLSTIYYNARHNALTLTTSDMREIRALVRKYNPRVSTDVKLIDMLATALRSEYVELINNIYVEPIEESTDRVKTGALVYVLHGIDGLQKYVFTVTKELITTLNKDLGLNLDSDASYNNVKASILKYKHGKV